MKLRYRLFLSVGILFALAFVISFYVEEHVTRANLNRTRESLLEELYKVNEKKRESIEAYIADMLWKIQARVDSVLQGIDQYQLVQKGFIPTPSNLETGTWLDSASLMVTNQWIGFIQNTNGNEPMSEIEIHSHELADTLHIPVSKEVHFIALRDQSDATLWHGPYIGINFDLKSWHKDGSLPSKKEIQGDYFVIFSPQAILNFKATSKDKHSLSLSINLLEPFLKWIEVPSEMFFLQSFIDKINEVKKLLEESPEIVPSSKEWQALVKKGEEGASDSEIDEFSCFTFIGQEPDKTSDQKLKHYREEVLSYVRRYIGMYNKIGLVWGLSALNRTHLFGDKPYGPLAPLAMEMVSHDKLCGKALLSSAVFKEGSGYDVEAALKGMDLTDDFITTHLDVITPKSYHHVFFGNTLKLKDPASDRIGYLTIGAHGAPVMSALARSTHQLAMFASKGEVITVSDPNGVEVPKNSPWYGMPVQKLMKESSGVIDFEGEEYFFLHISPYEQSDLHFFIFNPKDKEFQFINAINDGSETLLATVSMQMRIASIAALVFVLIILNNIAKRVTKPIAYLAAVTQTVATGKLHEIEIPDCPKTKRRDEIYDLYHAFFEMVRGLREKEKVRGVLNKVVSKEIAEETLKGNVQLGGEEKWATVFFADIRNFTAMTENMSPKDVIHLVNSCMTKISEQIDTYGGVIDKYVGDEVMALFGAPLEKKESALNAIKCAVDILESFNRWNNERLVRNEPPIKLGIGIHTGTVVAGNMGAEDRLNYTVLGANVNLASRLCDRAGEMQILISEDTLNEEEVKINIDVQPLDAIKLKGFTQPVPIFEVESYKREST